MPELQHAKLHTPATALDLSPRPTPPVRYVELHCKTNFSFLEGASHPDELVNQAAQLGYEGLAVTDRNSVAGVVRAHVAARQVGLKLLIGAEITLADAGPVLLWAMNREGYGRLCRLLTRGRRRAPKGECHLAFADVAEHADASARRRLAASGDRPLVGLAAVARRLHRSHVCGGRAASRPWRRAAIGPVATRGPGRQGSPWSRRATSITTTRPGDISRMC